MADHHLCEQQASNVTPKSIAQPKFISAVEIAAKARTNIQMVPEISDEELLEMALNSKRNILNNFLQ